MEDKKPLPELKELQTRIENARRKEDQAQQSKAPDPMRIGLELVSGVFVGGFLGFYLDKWLDTKPFLLILFFLLGAAAGFRNIYRLVDTAPADEKQKSEDK